MIGEYFSLHDLHTQEYGDGSEAVVLFQKGNFFEIYATDTRGPDLKKISSLLDVQLTKANKSISCTDEKNPYMIGFPVHSIRKYIKILMEAEFVVPVYVQKDPGMKTKIFREKLCVLTPAIYTPDFIESLFPSTNLQENNVVTSPQFLALVFDEDLPETAWAASIDMVTGKGSAWSCEAITTSFLHAYVPREVITNSVLLAAKQCKQSRQINIHGHNKLSFQKELLEKVYGRDPMVSVIERIGLEKHPGLVTAWTYLLDHVYSLNPKILDKICMPEVIHNNERCRLENGALEQLHLLGVMETVDKTVTPMGGRFLKAALTNPLCEAEPIQKRLRAIREFQQRTDDIVGEILKNAPDLERLHRRAILKVITPTEVHRIADLCERCESLPMFEEEFLKEKPDFESCWGLIRGMVCEEERLFVEGVFPEYDKALEKKQEILRLLEDTRDRLHRVIVGDGTETSTSSTVRIEYNERDGYHFVTTLKRSHALKNAGVKDMIYHQESKSQTVKIFLPSGDTTALLLRDQECMLQDLYVRCWHRVCDVLTHDNLMLTISSWIARLDFIRSSSVCIENMKYVLPEISDGSSTSSVRVEGMRHPVIERLVRDEWPYIPHSLGLDGDGYLLYGVNSSGKSSIMKAMGVCVILAQAGYAVPCTKMELCPYTAIFTRISGSDDMYRGLSSFTVELTELDRIIRDAGPQSLVLGDEVCRGTESVSGCAIVGAALGMLTSRRCSFVFATHLHELMSRAEITEDPRIRVAHLRVDEDHSQGGRLVFHRDLQPGSGRPVYGATVARHVIRNVEFGRRMEGFLNPPRLVLPKTSRYNAKKHINHCEKCFATDVPLDVHHMIPQKDADEKGFIKGTALHKNCLWNLLTLCEKCHEEEHLCCLPNIYEV